MKYGRFLTILLISLLFWIWRLPQVVSAAGSTFTVVPQKSATQIGPPNQGWYLHVQPDTDYHLTFQLGNVTKSRNVIEVQPVVVQTNSQLQLALDTPQAAPGPQAQYDFRKLVPSQTYTLGPQQVVTETINVHIPAAGIRGMVMGGLLFRSQTALQQQLQSLKNQHSQQRNSNFLSVAAISYSVYLQQKMQPLNVKLKLGAPQLNLQNQQVALTTPLQNVTAYPFVKGKLHLRVTNQKNHNLNFTEVVNNISIAANSKTAWQIPWQRGPLLAGKYQLTYTFTNPRMHYVFHRTLILTPKQVEQLNKFLPKEKPNYLIMITVIIIIAIALLILLTFLVYHFGRHQARIK
ncbi:WxL protein host-binding domain-containing protein [Bombilactobacillus bombi]|uniref:WxL protein host-binding domain-containing protein n=1 Tax=Bombilactobacillus bombi TaxID=1303590 RepID=UPI0015E61773|nr:DUF3324 domain-containing protein [Bombilactobacillus bombi]